jgi:hypothetical protein
VAVVSYPPKRGKKPTPDEEEFMQFCTILFGELEMNGDGKKRRGNGGLWRIRYRQHPAKAWACALQGKEDLQNRPATIRKGIAAFVTDLWKYDRLNFDKVSASAEALNSNQPGPTPRLHKGQI